MCNCKYCSERFNFDPKDGKEYLCCICLNDNNYLENCFAEDGNRCCYYEPPKAEFCQNATEENPVDDFVCSKCGVHLANWHRIDGEDWFEYEFKYCPNCGAKAKEEK